VYLLYIGLFGANYHTDFLYIHIRSPMCKMDCVVLLYEYRNNSSFTLVMLMVTAMTTPAGSIMLEWINRWSNSFDKLPLEFLQISFGGFSAWTRWFDDTGVQNYSLAYVLHTTPEPKALAISYICCDISRPALLLFSHLEYSSSSNLTTCQLSDVWHHVREMTSCECNSHDASSWTGWWSL
jgi:hypothetical protein